MSGLLGQLKKLARLGRRACVWHSWLDNGTAGMWTHIFPLLTLTSCCSLMLLWWWYSSTVSEKYGGWYQCNIEQLDSYSFLLAWLFRSSLLLCPKCLCPTLQKQLLKIVQEKVDFQHFYIFLVVDSVLLPGDLCDQRTLFCDVMTSCSVDVLVHSCLPGTSLFYLPLMWTRAWLHF